MDACTNCGDAIQVVEIRLARGRGPATMLGRCRKCAAQYRRTGTVEWVADPDDEADKPSKS